VSTTPSTTTPGKLGSTMPGSTMPVGTPVRDAAARPEDVAPEALAARLRLTNARLARRVRREALSAGDDLTASRLSALATIDDFGPITLGELATVEQVQPPSMTRIVARLEEHGLAVREVDAHDRRIVRVRVTDAGRAVLARSRTRKAAFLARRVARLSPQARATLARALPVLEQLIDD
jgi:DNA-binding MarR family transcriptional regulator